MVAIASQYTYPQMSRSGFPHHVRLPAACNNVPQHMKMFSDTVITALWHLLVLQQGIDRVGLGASRNGVY